MLSPEFNRLHYCFSTSNKPMLSKLTEYRTSLARPEKVIDYSLPLDELGCQTLSTQENLDFFDALCLLVNQGIHRFCIIFQKRQIQEDFITLGKALITVSPTTDQQGNQSLSVPYGRQQLVISEVTEQDGKRIKMSMGTQSAYLAHYTSIDAFLSAIKEDMVTSHELYSAIDPNPLSDIDFLKLSFKEEDLFVSQSVKATHERQISGKLVWAVTFSNGEVYYCKNMKSKEEDIAASSHVAGIDKDASKYGLRSFFTYQTSQLLRFNVVAKTRFFEFNGAWFYGLAEAKGQSAIKYATTLKKTFAKPNITRGTVQLQVMDAINGENDRHGHNCFIDEKAATVTAVDSDQCTGPLILHPHQTVRAMQLERFPPQVEKHLCRTFDMDAEEIAEDKDFKKTFSLTAWGVWLPPVLDTEMVANVKAVSENDLKKLMLKCRFTQKEIAAELSRLNAVKDHIAVLEARHNGAIAKIKPLSDDALEKLIPDQNQRAPVKKAVSEKQQAEKNEVLPGKDLSIIEPDQWADPDVIERLLPSKDAKEIRNHLHTTEKLIDATVRNSKNEVVKVKKVRVNTTYRAKNIRLDTGYLAREHRLQTERL